MMRPRWAYALFFLPALILLACALIALMTGDALVLTVSVAVPTALGTAGLVFGAIAAGIVILARRGERLADGAVARAEAEAGAHHRRFLDRLDHELKNPVTAIRSAVAASPVRTPQLEVVDAQTVRLSRLVGDLRKLAELQTAPLDLERVDVDVLVRDVVDAINDSHPRTIDVALPAAPWPLPAVGGDPDLLFVAVYNVVANAVKYSGDDARIEIRGHEAAGTVILEIADTGRGIPAGELDTVLDELARASNSRDRPGSGLGLALARVILERHAGQISVTSREGQGTNVRLTLPVLR